MGQMHIKHFIYEIILLVSLLLLGSAFFNLAHGTNAGVTEGAPVVAPAPEPATPSIDTTIIRQTEPLGGTSAEGVPVVTTPVEITPEGKVAAGSTDVSKTEEKIDNEMQNLPPQ